MSEEPSQVVQLPTSLSALSDIMPTTLTNPLKKIMPDNPVLRRLMSIVLCVVLAVSALLVLLIQCVWLAWNILTYPVWLVNHLRKHEHIH